MFKKAGILSTVVAAIVLPVASYAAAPLTIVNHSTQSSVVKFYINGKGLCSNLLGEAGITRPGATNHVPDGLLAANCISNPDNCTADVFINAQADCSGTPVGNVVYSINKGIVSASNGRVTVVSPNEIDLN